MSIHNDAWPYVELKDWIKSVPPGPIGRMSLFIWTFQCLTLVLAWRSFLWAAYQEAGEKVYNQWLFAHNKAQSAKQSYHLNSVCRKIKYPEWNPIHCEYLVDMFCRRCGLASYHYILVDSVAIRTDLLQLPLGLVQGAWFVLHLLLQFLLLSLGLQNVLLLLLLQGHQSLHLLFFFSQQPGGGGRNVTYLG